jgi:hypothetical protein
MSDSWIHDETGFAIRCALNRGSWQRYIMVFLQPFHERIENGPRRVDLAGDASKASPKCGAPGLSSENISKEETFK